MVTYFFRRNFTLIKQGGFQSLISTNTIAQGSAREDGLDVIVKQGGTINHAVKSMKWPGIAAVEVALVTITKQIWKGNFILGGKEVNTITPYLDDAETIGNPYPLKQNEGKSFQGSIVLGKGFVLEAYQAEALIAKDSRNREVLFPYITGDDLNNNPDQSPSRWVINFFDWSEDKAKQYPDCFEILERLVKPEREKVNRQVRAKYWWRFAERAEKLYHTINNLKRIYLINRHTKNVIGAFLPTTYIYSEATVVIAIQDYYDFAILSSSFHDIWTWKNSSTMGSSTIRYSGNDAFETFAFPKIKNNKIELIGEFYDNHRLKLIDNIKLGLTKTYNAFHAKEVQSGITTAALQGLDKKVIEKRYGKEVWNLWNHLQKTPNTCCFEEAVAGIIKLRELHVEMDEAVLEAYGWAFDSAQAPAVKLRHDFYEVDYLPENDRVRYTIHPNARKEILKRLLELNHRIHEEEVKQGLWEKKKVGKKQYPTKGGVPGDIVKEDEGGYGQGRLF